MYMTDPSVMRHVFLGYGTFVQLLYVQRGEIVWTTELHIKDFETARDVKIQVLSFSPDCKFLTVATQRYDQQKGPKDDGVWIRTFVVKEVATEGTLHGFCFMPTVSFMIE